MNATVTAPETVRKLPWKKWLIFSAGFGAGFAFVLGASVGIPIWHSSRPSPEKSLSKTAITGKFTGLTAQRRYDGKVHVWFRYALTNNNEMDYRLPANGTLMEGVPEGGVEKLQAVRWDSGVRVPPRTGLKNGKTEVFPRWRQAEERATTEV